MITRQQSKRNRILIDRAVINRQIRIVLRIYGNISGRLSRPKIHRSNPRLSASTSIVLVNRHAARIVSERIIHAVPSWIKAKSVFQSDCPRIRRFVYLFSPKQEKEDTHEGRTVDNPPIRFCKLSLISSEERQTRLAYPHHQPSFNLQNLYGSRGHRRVN